MMTEQEKLMQRLKEDYFKDMPEEMREKMIKLVIYMMLN